MSEPASISRGIAARYATAVFELAKEGKAIKALEADVATLAAALADSPDLNALISSPVYTREQSQAAITAVAKKAGLSANVVNTLSLMAQNRRLFVLPQLVAALADLLAEERGEVTAEVTSAKALTKAQSEKLAKVLTERVGKRSFVASLLQAAEHGAVSLERSGKS